MQSTAYYSDRSLSVLFHDFLAARDPCLRGDVDFYERLALDAGPNVLDLGCGAGRVAFALAKRGVNVTGVDSSPAMLALARSAQTQLPPDVAARVEIIGADMTTLALGRTFDVAILPFFAFSHFDSAGRGKIFAVIAGHLREGGRAAIHMVPQEWFAPLAAQQVNGPVPVPFDARWRKLRVRPVERTFGDDGLMVTAMEYTVYDADGRVLRQTRESLAYHPCSDAEIDRLAECAGLAVMERECRLWSGGPVQRMHLFERR